MVKMLRDFDDAVYCEKHGKGWKLWVAIADVSYYVRLRSALDVEAHNRGNSVYFPNRVVPMLPEILSNGLMLYLTHKWIVCVWCVRCKFLPKVSSQIIAFMKR